MSGSRYYKLSVCDGFEALDANNHRTSFPFHFHPTFNISLVYNGTFHTKLNDRSVVAPADSILITNPQEIHANPFNKEDSATFFTFYLSPDFLTYCNEGMHVFFDYKVIYDQALFDDLHNLKLALHSEISERNFENKSIPVFKQLTAKYGSGRNETNNILNTLFQAFLAEDNFEKFSLIDTAKRFGIDKFKFLRLFKFQTGLTPNNYFILKRIEKSKIMLKQGQGLLGVAIDLGFYDAAHFCNHFKKFTGVSPIAYTSALSCCNILQ